MAGTTKENSNPTVLRWVNFSLNETHTWAEIKEVAISDAKKEAKNKKENVGRNLNAKTKNEEVKVDRSTVLCYSYILKNHVFREEQIEDLMVISSPFFQMMNFEMTDVARNVVLQILKSGYEAKVQRETIKEILACEEVVKQLPPEFYANLILIAADESKTAQGFRDKIDWFNVRKYQNVSPEFLEKYSNIAIKSDPTPNTFTFDDEDESSMYIDNSALIHKGKSNKSKRNCKK